MNWLFLRARAGESLEGKSLAGELSARSNGNPTPNPFSWPARLMASWNTSRFGATYARLKEPLGVGWSTLLLRVFLASPSAPPESAKARPTKETCGPTPLEPFARLDPSGACWKTCQGFLPLDISEPSFQTWPRRGSMRNGECFRPLNVEPSTCGKGSGLWATPNAADAVGSHGGGQGRSLRTDISNWKKTLLPTPKATEYKGGHSSHGGSPSLGMMATHNLWPTPEAANFQGYQTSGGKKYPRLGTAVQNFPTPNASDAKGHRFHKGGNPCLLEAARTFPTPTRRDSRSFKGSEPKPKHQGGTNLIQTVGGQLNPDWVEWLMGWPIGWTDLRRLAMDKFRQWRRKHGLN